MTTYASTIAERANFMGGVLEGVKLTIAERAHVRDVRAENARRLELDRQRAAEARTHLQRALEARNRQWGAPLGADAIAADPELAAIQQERVDFLAKKREQDRARRQTPAGKAAAARQATRKRQQRRLGPIMVGNEERIKGARSRGPSMAKVHTATRNATRNAAHKGGA